VLAEYVIDGARRQHGFVTRSRINLSGCPDARSQSFADMCAQCGLFATTAAGGLLARDKRLWSYARLGMKWAENCGPIRFIE